MKTMLRVGLLMLATLTVKAQNEKGDTVVVKLANTSQVVFTMHDRADVELLKQYDFQSLFNDIITKIEKSDTAKVDVPVVITTEEEDDDDDENWSLKSGEGDKGDEDCEGNWNWGKKHKGKNRRTKQSFNFDLGTNNYLSNGKFPDGDNALYTVRPWGSWYVAANSIQRTRISNKVFLEWGLGVSWYNFKFQNDKTIISKDDNGLNFSLDQRDVNSIKSKLTVSYINASLVPVIDFGGDSKKARVWGGYHNGFRLGVGPYVGYRMGSHTKMAYKDDGSREKDHNRDNFYLENFRYGVRAQIGYRSTDIFINYDMNDLFIAGKGPQVNAISFGVIF